MTPKQKEKFNALVEREDEARELVAILEKKDDEIHNQVSQACRDLDKVSEQLYNQCIKFGLKNDQGKIK
jgi:hypothetical protein